MFVGDIILFYKLRLHRRNVRAPAGWRHMGRENGRDSARGQVQRGTLRRTDSRVDDMVHFHLRKHSSFCRLAKTEECDDCNTMLLFWMSSR